MLRASDILRPFGEPFQRIRNRNCFVPEFAGQVRDAFGNQLNPSRLALLVQGVK